MHCKFQSLALRQQKHIFRSDPRLSTAHDEWWAFSLFMNSSKTQRICAYWLVWQDLQIYEMIFCCCLTSLKWLKSLGKYCRGSSLVPVSTCVLNGREKDSSKDLPAHLSSAKCPEGKWTIKVSVKHQGAICMSSLLSSVCPTDRPVPFLRGMDTAWAFVLFRSND